MRIFCPDGDDLAAFFNFRRNASIFNKDAGMKHLNWLLSGMVLALSLSLAMPALAAFHKNGAERTTMHKKNVKSSKKSAQKAGQLSKKSETGKKTASRSTSTKKAENVKDSREVWLKRAQESEILTGQASWYGKDFHKKATASGVDYDMYTFTAAHRTLPMGTIVKVTDASRGNSVMVCVTDRGPYVRGRIIDLSYAAARKLDLEDRGVCNVRLEVVSDEKGKPLKPGLAYYVRYGSGGNVDRVGPFKGFADAAAMHEALSQAHPDAEVVLDSTR